MNEITIEEMITHIDGLFQDTLDASKMIRTLNIDQKAEKAILKNFEKITYNFLVLADRLSKEQK